MQKHAANCQALKLVWSRTYVTGRHWQIAWRTHDENPCVDGSVVPSERFEAMS